MASQRPSRKIGYLINQYPMGSLTFVRRELAALEALGATIHRYAIRAAPGTLSDPADVAEVARTRRLLDAGKVGLVVDALRTIVANPIRFARALRLTGRLARIAGRGWLKHLLYLGEACVLRAWLRRDGIDHLHAHFGTNPAAVALLCRTLGGPPFSFTVHGPEEFDRQVELALDLKIRGCAFVVAIGSFGRSQLWRWIDYADWPKVQVVHCGLEASDIDAAPTPPALARRLVNVGRLEEQKGQLILVEAAAQLVAAGVTDFEIVIIGDGRFRDRLAAAITARGVEAQVKLVGWMTGAEVRAQIRGGRGFVLPSFGEGLPVVIMEALALHRPVIATFIASVPELVRPGETGWLVPAGDVAALAEAIQALLATPTDRLAAMGAAGARAVAAEHDVRREARKLLDLFGRADPTTAGDPAIVAVGPAVGLPGPPELARSARTDLGH